MVHYIIIGNGIAGSTAAVELASDKRHKVTMISEESKSPYARTSLMYIFMGQVPFEQTKLYEEKFWDNRGVTRIQAKVQKILPNEKKIQLAGGTQLHYDTLILATGSVVRKIDWPGAQFDGVQGLYFLSDLEKLEERIQAGARSAVIVGGGLIGVELAEMLLSRGLTVTMLIREKSYWASVLPQEESEMVTNHLIRMGVHLRLTEELDEILGEDGSVRAVRCKHGQKTIPCDIVGITIGVTPQVDLAREAGIRCQSGILVDALLKTSQEDIYAIGDCVELQSPAQDRKSVEAIWYTAREMGLCLGRTLLGEPTPYHQGIWFNSAKFFHIEYQIYGQVTPASLAVQESIFWRHPDGEKSIRIQFDSMTKAVTGFLLLGIRYRHAVCEKWILEGAHIETVLAQLSLANFDPEFFETYEAQLLDEYNAKYQRNIKLPSKKLGLRSVLSLLGMSDKPKPVFPSAVSDQIKSFKA